jgi:hypothetical protein
VASARSRCDHDSVGELERRTLSERVASDLFGIAQVEQDVAQSHDIERGFLGLSAAAVPSSGSG